MYSNGLGTEVCLERKSQAEMVHNSYSLVNMELLASSRGIKNIGYVLPLTH